MAFHVVVAQGTGDFIPFQVRLKIAIDYRSSMRSHLQINPSAAQNPEKAAGWESVQIDLCTSIHTS